MANKKFSEFTLKTDSANVDFVVGYDGTDNVRIAPSNLGGGGASDLNGLTDCLVTAQASQFIGNVPANVTSGAYNNRNFCFWFSNKRYWNCRYWCWCFRKSKCWFCFWF